MALEATLSVRRIAGRLTDGIDSSLLIVMLGLSMLGLATLFSASYDAPSRVVAQVVNLGVALVAMWVVAQISPQKKIGRAHV